MIKIKKEIKKELKYGLTGTVTEVMSKYGNIRFNKKKLISRSSEDSCIVVHQNSSVEHALCLKAQGCESAQYALEMLSYLDVR